MNGLLIYMLQSGLLLTVFYLIYRWWLSKETFFMANRFFLLAGLVVAIVLPLFKITYPVVVLPGSMPNLLPETAVAIPEEYHFASKPQITQWERTVPWLIKLYFTISAVLLMYLAFQTAQFWGLIRSTKKTTINGLNIINASRYTLPFSFFNYIMVDLQLFSEEEKMHVLAHEQTHIKQKHWIDLLFASIATAIFWINPIMWRYRRAIRENHEYLADAGALQADDQAGAYMKVLLKGYIGDPALQLSNSYNTRTHKNRFRMIQKRKSSVRRLWLMLVTFPLIAIIAMAFASPKYIQSAKDPDKATIATDDASAALTERRTIKGKVLNKETGEGISGANVIIKNTTTGTVTDRNGEFALSISPEHTAIAISYVGYQSETIPVTAEDYFEVLLQVKTYMIKPDTTRSSPKSSDPHVSGNEVFTVVEEMPSPAAGNINNLYAEHINPEAWRVFDATHETGTVFVEFVITAAGDVANVKVVKSENVQLNAHAIGIIEKTKWNPGEQRGVKVPVRAATPVRFPPVKD